MFSRHNLYGWPILMARAAAIGVIALSLASPMSAFGQRGGGPSDRSGGGRGNSGGSPRREEPQRNYTPRRETPPPPAQRREDPPRRETLPPPSQRRDESPRRDDSFNRSGWTPRFGDRTGGDRAGGNNRSGGDRSGTGGTDRAPRDTYAPRDRGTGNTYDRSRTDNGRGPGDIFNRRGGDRNGSGDSRIGTQTPGRLPGYSGGINRDRARSDNNWQPRNRARDIFTRSVEGRRYQNGIYLRPGGYVSNSRIRHFFTGGYSYYPYYYPYSTFDFSISFYSPYSFYYGVCPPYIYRRHTYYYPPSVVYIEVPIYVGDSTRGYDDRYLDDYYLNRRDYYDASDDPSLETAMDDIREAFRYGNIEPLVNLTDPKVRIAVYLRGKYQYSLDPNDYLDMTRDAMGTIDTIQFDLYRVRHRANGVYVVSGKHVYRDRDGNNRTVYVSFVLERLQGRWTITQIGTAPDRIQEW